MNGTILRSLLLAESALSSAAFTATAHGRRFNAGDLQDIAEHVEELHDRLRALQHLVDELRLMHRGDT